MLRKIFRFVDTFIPAETAPSLQTRFRFRLVVILYFVSIFFGSAFLISTILIGLEKSPLVLMVSLSVTLNIVGILLIRKAYSAEKIVVANICIGFTITVFDVLAITKSIVPAINVFSSNLLLAFLVFPEAKIRIFVMAWGLACTVACLALAGRFGISLPALASPMLETMTSSVISMILGLLILIFVYLKIKGITEKELNQEHEWQERSLQLNEISSMTSIMRSLMNLPLQAFMSDWRAFRSEPADERTKARMRRELDDLMSISQSFSWIYRAYRREKACAALSQTLLQHLQVLLSFKVAETGWSLNAKPVERSVEIYGPIPSMMLLLFSTILQILESDQPEELRRLYVHVHHEGESIKWTISWPDSSRDGARQWLDQENLSPRNEMIEDLKKACLATIDEYEDEGLRHLQISGAWLSWSAQSDLSEGSQA